MIVVADSSPLHYLILLDQADLLRQLYGDVLIPSAVVAELSASGAPPKVRDWLGQNPSWLKIPHVAPDQVQTISPALDLGEREAIALAQVVRANLLLMDDLAGREAARRLNLLVTGTLGVLRHGRRKGVDRCSTSDF